MDQTVYLTLQNGQVFEGKGFGAAADVTEELVFNTGVTGYLETLTDPGCHGLMVMQTFPLMGNYGVISADLESKKCHAAAYIVKEWCQEPSNFRCEGVLDAFLKAHGVPGMYGIDTRALTRLVREEGVMNARLSAQPLTQEEVAALAARKAAGGVAETSCTQRRDLPARPERSARYRVVLWNLGARASLAAQLQKRGCQIIELPWSITAGEIKDLNPDGIVLSGGPGDPAENQGVIRELAELCRAKLPMMGIGLGHQLLALAQGGKTCKMKCGHRGANQPVAEQGTDRVYITGQNHGYMVAQDGLPANAEASFVNANDGTVEGLTYTDMPAFSVQFHPGVCGGPKDTDFLFDRFVETMSRNTRG